MRRQGETCLNAARRGQAAEADKLATAQAERLAEERARAEALEKDCAEKGARIAEVDAEVARFKQEVRPLLFDGHQLREDPGSN